MCGGCLSVAYTLTRVRGNDDDDDDRLGLKEKSIAILIFMVENPIFIGPRSKE